MYIQYIHAIRTKHASKQAGQPAEMIDDGSHNYVQSGLRTTRRAAAPRRRAPCRGAWIRGCACMCRGVLRRARHARPWWLVRSSHMRQPSPAQPCPALPCLVQLRVPQAFRCWPWPRGMDRMSTCTVHAYVCMYVCGCIYVCMFVYIYIYVCICVKCVCIRYIYIYT